MTPYGNISGKSGVKSYKLGDNYIIVEFTKPTKNGTCFYEYTDAGVGAANVKIMKNLARQGEGLNSYISSNEEIKYGYSRTW